MTKKTKKYVEENPKTMLLIKSAFGSMKSFKMIPIHDDCPYVECLFSPGEKIMVVISKFMKPRPGGQKIREERRAMDTCSEHYVVTEEEIREMIKMFAVNPDALDLDEFFLDEAGLDIIGATASTPILEKV